MAHSSLKSFRLPLFLWSGKTQGILLFFFVANMLLLLFRINLYHYQANDRSYYGRAIINFCVKIVVTTGLA